MQNETRMRMHTNRSTYPATQITSKSQIQSKISFIVSNGVQRLDYTNSAAAFLCLGSERAEKLDGLLAVHSLGITGTMVLRGIYCSVTYKDT